MRIELRMNVKFQFTSWIWNEQDGPMHNCKLNLNKCN